MARSATRTAAVEFLVEPFAEGAPGDHVEAATAAFTGNGLEVEVGPFSSVATGDLDELAAAVRNMILSAMEAGATSIRMQVGDDRQTLNASTLHDALDVMIRSAERELGAAAGEWTREQKQSVVRMLDERGAFLLRGAVDDIARVMGVSRITIYNYLSAIESTNDG